MNTTPQLLALRRAVEKLGGQSATARALGGKVKQGHIWSWLNKTGVVPPEQARALSAKCGGSPSIYELRPDVFGDAEPPKEAAA